MAEPFGAAAGALGILGLFNNCVDSLGCIRLARTFGRDYQLCQLKLDISKWRLTKFGQSINIVRVGQSAPQNPADDKTTQAQAILQDIMELMDDAQKKSQRYERRKKTVQAGLCSPSEMAPVGQQLHSRLGDLAKKRHTSVSLFRKVSWALYDKDELQGLLKEISGLLDDLETLYSVQSVCRELAEAEMRRVGDWPSLAVLRDAAKGTDKVLSEIIADEMSNVIATENKAEEIVAADGIDVQVGNQFANVQGLHDLTVNEVKKVHGGGKAKVQIGNQYGYPAS